jgi:hypothetical protein
LGVHSLKPNEQSICRQEFIGFRRLSAPHFPNLPILSFPSLKHEEIPALEDSELKFSSLEIYRRHPTHDHVSLTQPPPLSIAGEIR